MNVEKAIRNIEVASAEVEWNYPMDYAIAFTMAVEALGYRIPKEVVKCSLDNGNVAYKCPRCNVINNQFHTVMQGNFCPNCGQKLVK